MEKKDLEGSRFGLWDVVYAGYEGERKLYGSDHTTAKMAADFLNSPEVRVIEDWGCGYGGFKKFIGGDQKYIGVDGSVSPFADVIADLTEYRSEPDGLLLRHVLEHNPRWQAVLENALASFQKRMVIVIFTPFVCRTKVVNRYPSWRGDERGVDMVDIGFNREELLALLDGRFSWEVERVRTNTQYRREHLFYFTKD